MTTYYFGDFKTELSITKAGSRCRLRIINQRMVNAPGMCANIDIRNGFPMSYKVFDGVADFES